MDVDGFWAIVDAARVQVRGQWWDVPPAVVALLIELPEDDIVDFAQIQDELEWAAYRGDIHTACRLINAGFGSDDLFLYFRDWMLIQGRAAFEAALTDPDSLADIDGVLEMNPIATDEFAECEEFLYAASDAWREITGEEDDETDGLEDELAARGYERHRDDPVPTRGDPIEFDDREAVMAVFPRLGARFYDLALVSRRQMPRGPAAT